MISRIMVTGAPPEHEANQARINALLTKLYDVLEPEMAATDEQSASAITALIQVLAWAIIGKGRSPEHASRGAELVGANLLNFVRNELHAVQVAGQPIQ